MEMDYANGIMNEWGIPHATAIAGEIHIKVAHTVFRGWFFMTLVEVDVFKITRCDWMRIVRSKTVSNFYFLIL